MGTTNGDKLRGGINVGEYVKRCTKKVEHVKEGRRMIYASKKYANIRNFSSPWTNIDTGVPGGTVQQHRVLPDI